MRACGEIDGCADVLQDMAELPPIDQHLEKEHQEKTKVKNIQCVEMGKYEVSGPVLLCAIGMAQGQWPSMRRSIRDSPLRHLHTAVCCIIIHC